MNIVQESVAFADEIQMLFDDNFALVLFEN